MLEPRVPEGVADDVMALAVYTATTPASSAALLECADALLAVSRAAAAENWFGAAEIVHLIGRAIERRAGADDLPPEELWGTVERTVVRLRAHLDAPQDRAAAAALADCGRDPLLSIEESEFNAAGLIDALCRDGVATRDGADSDPWQPLLLDSDGDGDADDADILASDWRVPEGDDVALEDVSRLLHADFMAEGGGAPAPHRAKPKEPLPLPPTAADEHRPLPKAFRELVDILLAELPQLEVAFAELLGYEAASDRDPAVRAELFAMSIELVQRFGAAAEAIGLRGLASACAHAGRNLELTAQNDAPLVGIASGPFAALTPALRTYLLAPLGSGPAAALTGVLADESLPDAIDAAEAAALAVLLSQPDLASGDVAARVQTATRAEVALDVPADVNPDLLDGLLQELPQHVEEFSAAVQRLVANGSLDDVNVAQRVAHTLKGASNTVGIRGLAELTHHLEDILLALAKHETLPSRALGTTLLTAADCLAAMADSVAGQGPPPNDALAVLQQVLDWANRIDRDGPPAAADDTQHEPLVAAPAAEPAVAAGPLDTERSDDARAGGGSLRVPAKLIDELLRIVGENFILNAQLHERLRETRESSRAMARQVELLRQIGADLEEVVDVKDLNAAGGRAAASEHFDALELDQYNELHTYSRRMIEAAIDARELGRGVVDQLARIQDMLVDQERLNREAQEGVLHTRMVPVKSVFQRLQRCVRQACRLTGKLAELELGGGDTLIDSDVLGKILDPLMHLLRNAVDHGIEVAAVREELGKARTGRVRLSFARDGNSILVRCADDGAGVDWDAIRAHARERGLIEPTANPSDDELKSLLVRPNFTTRTEVTQTSGRGIGLDVVHSEVVRLGGSLNIASALGQGSSFEVLLPVTLLSSHALLVRHGEQVLAVASRSVQQMAHIEEGVLGQIGDQAVFRMGERVYRARHLSTVLGGSGEAARAAPRTVFLVDVEGSTEAILVDSVLGGRDLVVKTLGRYVPKLPGVAGATILGDGRVAPVLDLPELLRDPVEIARGTRATAGEGGEGAARPLALVVDDSLSARRALAQLLADSGYRVQTARDGLEAVEVLKQATPQIVFVDLEMPRMNGIELTAHLRGRPQTAALPVVMVTSRSTVKHREQAERAGVNAYLTKPFADDTLLETAATLLTATRELATTAA